MKLNFNPTPVGSVIIIDFNGAADQVKRDQKIELLITAPTFVIPNKSVALLLRLNCRIQSKGAAGLHEFVANVFTPAGGIFNVAFACYEPAGMVPGIWIGGGAGKLIAPITGPDLQITTQFFDSAGNGFGSAVQSASVDGFYFYNDEVHCPAFT